MIVSQPTQLPLALPHAPSYRREDFVPGPSNREALKLIESWPDWPSPVLLLFGPAGSGKTHLVRIWAERARAVVVTADALLDERAPILSDRGALAIEDVAADSVPEHPLFHLFNAAREHQASLLVTSRDRPEDWKVNLPDLRSRLRLATPAVLGSPEDELLRQVLVKLFADRQLLVDRPVIDYLLARMERSLSAAAMLVEAIDHSALSAGRRINRAMAAAVLAEAPDAVEEFPEQQ